MAPEEKDLQTVPPRRYFIKFLRCQWIAFKSGNKAAAMIAKTSTVLTLPSMGLLATWTLLAALPFHAWADDGNSLVPLNERQVALITQFDLAYAANDFKAQREVMQRLYEITKDDTTGKRLVTAAEARMILNELDAALAMNAESFQKARQHQIENQLGKSDAHRGDFVGAVSHLNKALDFAKVYDDDSYCILESKMLLASVILHSGKDLDKGASYAIEVKTALENRNMADCYLYGENLAYLFVLQLASNRVIEGIENGEKLIRLYQTQGTERTLRFAKVTGIVAEHLNGVKEYERAYHIAALGLKTCPELTGGDVRHGLRLLQECARAAVSLEDYEQVPVMYERILAIIAATPGYPDDLRLGFLEEYSVVLEKMNSETRGKEITREIEKIKNPAVPQKSRYSD
ncbi:hypothetical protein LOC68_07605 [Blastopirellula sp. JC732]|uniref:Uncharacterized protein n=1 Tax=Blastopirellula sediminis TaxID=2894196 RepID=A0A9X1SG39_9BACT|nr:hypothetical protein [Blastopirellula sediminis]MCC9608967.1 hypothetical protein [Blastopirellula sediminis]MCC9628256.1 hypothetical protein [Blastopirellula sediminis]